MPRQGDRGSEGENDALPLLLLVPCRIRMAFVVRIAVAMATLSHTMVEMSDLERMWTHEKRENGRLTVIASMIW